MPMTTQGNATLCFIYHLPTEILEDIFIHCACGYVDVGHNVPTGVPSWVNVSYVSRHWRNIALSYPTLWSYLFVTSVRWSEELLTRSKQVPLKLQVNLYRRDERRVLDAVRQVMNHMERIQRLHIMVPRANRYHDLLFAMSGFFSSAHCLQELRILVGGSPPAGWYTRLFNRDTPALRTLELSNSAVPACDLFNLRNLTTLSLHRVSSMLQQDAATFLTSLTCSPTLRHLYLDSSICPASHLTSNETHRPLQKVDIPQLSRLLIVGPLSIIVEFFSWANVPSKTQVRLHVSDGSTNDEDSDDWSDSESELSSPASSRPSKPHHYAPLCSLLARQFTASNDEAPSSPTIRSLVIASGVDGEAKLTFSACERDGDHFDSPSFANWYWDCNIHLQIIVHPHRSTVANVMDCIVGNICCAVPLTDVQSVHVIDSTFSQTFWDALLARLEGLRYLRISEGDMPDLAPLLRVNCAEKQGGNTVLHRTYVPGLEELELYNVGFSTGLETDVVPFAGDVQSLLDALSTRTEHRGRLTVTRCTESNSYYMVNDLDMVGRWGGGRFHMVDKQLAPRCSEVT